MRPGQTLYVALLVIASAGVHATEELNSAGIATGATLSWLAGGQYFYDAPRFRDIEIRKIVNAVAPMGGAADAV